MVHFREQFGAVTENWISRQIAGLDGVEPCVYAVRRVEKGDCPVERFRCVEEGLSPAVMQLNRMARRFLHRYPQLLVWLWVDRAELVHAHFGPDGHYILPFAKWLGVPLVTSFYGQDAYRLPIIRPAWRTWYRKLFRQGDLFLAEGPAMRAKLVELDCPQEKVMVHHVGIDFEKYKLEIRKPNGQVRLLICGRFVEKKGIPYAVDALGIARAKTKADIRLTVVGDSDREETLTEEKKRIFAAVNRNRLQDAVHFTGFVPHEQLLRLAREHHILLAPSVHAADGDAEGGFPVILTEVSAMGMPVVAFDHCDIPEVVQDGRSGFLVPQRDVQGLADRIIHLAEHPELWPDMGRAGRAHVEANFDIRKLNQHLVEIYRGLIQCGGRRWRWGMLRHASDSVRVGGRVRRD